MGVDFGPYLSNVLYQIRKHWFDQIPDVAKAPTRKSGKVSIEFHILPSGQLSGLTVVSSSGNADLDRGAADGIRSCAPFPPLPVQFTGPDLALRINFFYNPANLNELKSPVSKSGDTIALAETLISSDTAAGHLIRKTEPEYPSKALDAQIEGDVTLDVLIGKNGKTKNIQVVSGDSVLARAAVDAVKHWRYTPFTAEGKPVETPTTVTIKFVITKGPINCPGQQGDIYAFLPDALTATKVDPTNPDTRAQVFRVGHHVSPPRPIYAPGPEYSEKARKAKQQGTAVLRVIVTPEGKVALVKVLKVIGYGLDQQAVNAVCQWKFQPALKDGQPVPVEINIEVSFRLY